MKNLERKIEKPVLVLLSIAAALALAIFAGTIYARVTNRASSRGETASAAGAGAQTGEDRGFLEVGRTRVVLAPETGSETSALLIVKTSIPYSLSDGQFQEELIRKLPEIRDTVRAFFSLYTLSELQSTPESEIKEKLLARLNNLLVLGKPDEIYFEEFIFFE